MATNRDDLKLVRQRNYLGKDFDSFRSQLLEYARTYYPDKIRDFSESSLGGLFLDMASYVGDVMSFYLDHQYSELNIDSAVETINIERILKSSGVPIVGAAPALVPITIYVEVPSTTLGVPSATALPKILAGSIFSSDSGVDFTLLEDVDFNKKLSDGNYQAKIRNGSVTGNQIVTHIMALEGLCISGKEETETIALDSEFVPFRKITLNNSNISEIITVNDGYGNQYYQVSSLTHDVVYKNVLNTYKDNDLVKDSIKVIPAPYRYTVEGDLATRRSILTFGGGSAVTLEDDAIPDPSEFAISFPYTKTFSRIPVNPEKLLQTNTLGVISTDTTMEITYRYGGGLDHNVPANTIKTIKQINVFFPGNPTPNIAAAVRSSIEVNNNIQASGGEDAPTVDDLKNLMPSIRNSQERIVTREDLIARVYTLPSNFGRVFRASIRSNPMNPLATQLFIISRDAENKLIISPDTLKRNLKTYLNPYRMISDAIDILDARVINLTLSFDVLIDPTLNRSVVLQNILSKLQTHFNIKNFHIDQPIVISELVNKIFTVPGVLSINNILFQNVTGIRGDDINVSKRYYSDNTFDVQTYTKQGVIFPPPGSIFEIKYPEYDIVGKAST